MCGRPSSRLNRDPTPDEERESLDELNLPKWKSFASKSDHYLLMDDEFTLETDYPSR